MRRGGQLWLALGLAAAVQAGEPDGAVAPAARWTGPRGPAGGGHRSAALPIVGEPEEAWSYELPGPAIGPPVHWDGVAYVLCRTKKNRVLVALDLQRGVRRARKSVGPGPDAALQMADGMVMIVGGKGDWLAGHQLRGKVIYRRWRIRLRSLGGGYSRLGPPTTVENEIYLLADWRLTKLQPPRTTPVWQARADVLFGQPAIYGPYVFALGNHTEPGYEPSLHLFVYDRRRGHLIKRVNIAGYEGDPPKLSDRGSVTITPKMIYMKGPEPFASSVGAMPYAALAWELTPTGPTFEKQATLNGFLLPPSSHPKGVLGLSKRTEIQWQIWTPQGGLTVTSHADRQDLFRHRVPATVLGDIAYFGSWAADLATAEILWHLPVTDVRFAAVPADRLVLVVEGNKLRAFREREVRK